MQTSLIFSPFELDTTARRLLRAGQPVPVGARALDLLQALIEQRHRVVSKTELLDRVWPGLVVEENNPQVQVSNLRKLLGTEVIATVPGVGYRFTRRLDEETHPVRDPVGETHAPAPCTQGSGRTLLGREADITEVLALLQAHPLVTLTGPGGMGKTRLAQALRPLMAERLGPWVPWVSLAEAHDAPSLMNHLVQALALPIDGEPSPEALARQVHGQGLRALVLDNAEGLAPAVATLVMALREQAPALTVLVTSQVPLKVPGEWVHRLAPLACPAPGSPLPEIEASAAVQLFVATMQATGARPLLSETTLGQVAHLCRQLEGMPLAIELAASRAAWMGVEALLGMLGERLHLLGRTDHQHPPRQHTVMATLDWSHSLLPPTAQRVYRQLGLLRGPFSLPLAVAFLADDTLPAWEVLDTLSQLVDRSLLMLCQSDPPRYRLLACTREHALAELTRHQGLEAAQQRLADTLTAWMNQAHQAYWAEPDGPWLARHRDDIEPLRMALDWASQHRPAQAIELLGASLCLFMLLGRAAEARQRAEALLPFVQAGGDVAPGVLGRLCIELSRLYWGVSAPRQHALALEGLAHHRAAGDPRGTYLALRVVIGSGCQPPTDTAPLLAEMQALEDPAWPPRVLVQRHFARQAWTQAAGQHEASLAEAQALQWMADDAGLALMAAAARCLQASAHLRLGQADAAQALAMHLLARAGDRPSVFDIHAHRVLAEVHLQHGDLAAARATLQALVAAAMGRDGEWLSLHADVLARLAVLEGRWSSAARLLGCAGRIDPALREAMTGRPDTLPALQGQVQAAMPASAWQGLLAQGARMDPAGVQACLVTPT